MSTTMKPARRPATTHFSSGPCAKRPGWSLKNLQHAFLGRSHRAKDGKARLKLAIDKTKALLALPPHYRCAIVPASDTGAFEMAMWGMLGARGIDALSWESFGEGWVSDISKQLKLSDVRVLRAEYGRLPDLASRLQPRRALHLEWYDLRRAGAQFGMDRQRPYGSHFCGRHVGGVRAAD
jgi:phosphoserine aminotransferase